MFIMYVHACIFDACIFDSVETAVCMVLEVFNVCKMVNVLQ